MRVPIVGEFSVVSLGICLNFCYSITLENSLKSIFLLGYSRDAKRTL